MSEHLSSTKNTMNRIHHMIKQYQLLTDWYISVLEGISEEDGSKLITGQTNSLEWLAGHLIVGRYRNMVRLGVQIEPYVHLVQFIDQSIPPPNAIAFDPNMKYSTLSECTEQWITYADIFMKALKNADENLLNKEIPFTVITGGNTVADALDFVIMHESYHIGQMSTIRKMMGYPSMQLGARK